jgi:lipoprotein-anchoring transpeptidase ErfK/SrfK
VHRARTISALLVLVMCAACGSHASTPAAAPPSTRVTPSTKAPAPTTTTPPNGSLVATAHVPNLVVYDAPNGKPIQALPNPWLFEPSNASTAVPQIFLVAQTTNSGWVQVLLPIRPNGTTGWVKASDVSLANDPYHIKVSLSAHQITVKNGDSPVYQGPVATGLPATPTPTGHYYLRVLIKAINPNTVYGPYAYGLSSHSNVYSTFEGGDAEIGIHGNDNAAVLGHDASHGCIRMDNTEITKLASILPLGTPVDVTQ